MSPVSRVSRRLRRPEGRRLLLPWLLSPAFVATTLASPVAAQQVVLRSHGFSYGTSSGSSSLVRQQSRSEANVLRQVVTLNASPLEPGGQRYRIDDPSQPFSVVEVINSQAASDSQTTINRSIQSGQSFSVFTD